MVGWVKEPEKIIEIKEAMGVEAFGVVRLRYMGDNLVFLSGESGTNVKEFVEEKKDWLSNFFTAFEPWQPSIYYPR